ncbi:substrate-binding domain-containing protein [Thiocystis violascens]|uniref:ABC-type molybdate transport system, periplasmic component n=1 Tax=Thiocystis violascens (strain ATCC 17096 / DSM 198 / 6111) TaxID=765911 RepID=I3Y9P8_THIV6|nr:substrate-binding domain-containing protein [Thiocystis violascens]AFL73716.1 ABC-type molybdate transport system, periplasmic component [Thiocystis violascens DSM 198]
MLSFFRRIVILTLAILSAGSAFAQGDRPELLLYCGITMVRPMTEIAQIFEQREGVKITIAQGGSEDLYQSAKKSGVGEWYLPGEPSYRDKHQPEGLLGDFATVGYNQMALMVQKGNPKQVKPDPRELLRKDLIAIVGNAESGSVGQEAKAILDALGIYQKVLRAAAFLAPDSRSLMNAMKKQEADVTLAWRATGFFPDNAARLEVIDLDPSLAKPQALLLIQLNSAKHPELVSGFMNFAAGDEGQAIFRKHGFLDNQTVSDH